MTYAVGLPWLAVSLAALGLAHDPATVLASGLVPFLVGDAAKAMLAGVLLPFLWRRVPARRR